MRRADTKESTGMCLKKHRSGRLNPIWLHSKLMIRKGWEKTGERIIERRELEEALAMGVYGCLCVSRSIDSASVSSAAM